MAKLNAAARSSIPSDEFGLPGQRKYPMPDASHAANAKARATQAVNAGRMAPETADRIKAKASRVIARLRR
jgi:hypothetical protein